MIAIQRRTCSAIFEGAAEEVHSNVLTDRYDEVQRMQAENEFARRNCGLLK